MARSGAGVYSLFTPGNPVVTGTTISSAWANGTLNDLATAMTDSLSRSGLGGMTAAMRGIDGTASTPAYSFTADPNTGLYSVGADQLGLSAGGTLRATVAAALTTLVGNVAVSAPGAGVALAVTGLAAGTSQTWTDGTRTATLNHAASRVDFGSTTADILGLLTSGTRRVEIGATGGTTFNAPTSGPAVTINPVSGGASPGISMTEAAFASVELTSTGQTTRIASSNSGVGSIGTSTNHAFAVITNGSSRGVWGAAGGLSLSAPTSGQTLTVVPLGGTGSGVLVEAASAIDCGMLIRNTSLTASTGLRLNTAAAGVCSVLAVGPSAQLSLGGNSTGYLTCTGTGTWAFAAPGSGTTVTVNATGPTGAGLTTLGNTILGTDNTSQVRFNNIQATTVGAAGGASALPATPLGYITVNVNAVQCKIPFYNT